MAQSFVVDIKSGIDDKRVLGDLGYELAAIASAKIDVPNGFIITTYAYFEFVRVNKLQQKIKHLIGSHGDNSLEAVSKHFKRNILKSHVPDEVLTSLFNSYRSFGWTDKKATLIPSLTDPDLKLKPITDVKGEAVFLQDVKNVWASFFDHELLAHRHSRNLNHFKTGIAIVVIEDLASQKEGYIAEAKITVTKGRGVSEREEEELLEIEEKILGLHYFPKRIYWIISGSKIYVTNTIPRDDSATKIYFQPKEERVEAQVVEREHISIGGIATGVVGKEIVVINDLNYEKLKELRHAKAIIVEKSITNPHLKIVLQRMGFPVVSGLKTNLKPGTVVTVDAIKNQVYKGEFKV